MKKIFFPILLITIISVFFGCKKWSEERTSIYQYVPVPASPISDAAPLCGNIKGTMLSGKTYTIGCDVYVLPKDTLIIQPGVTINVTNQAGIVVQGTFISLGTQANPNWITVKGLVKNDAPNTPVASDPAYSGQWKGIIGATTCNLMVIKWTHIEFAGAAYGSVIGQVVNQSNTTSFAVLFQNYNGNFIMEDSWVYGCTDDAMRLSSGKIAVMRNTFEKTGPSGGDCINTKGGTVGTMAYNMFIGTATNGQKASNKGLPVGAPQTNIVMYNSTFVNGGYRQIQTGRGANIDFEEGARGMYYNNVAINCKFGYRVVSSPAADTTHLSYGNNYQYADAVAIANQFYPTGYISKPQPTDIPDPASYLPANYGIGKVFDGTAVVGKNNPLFANYPLPSKDGVSPGGITSIGSFNFHLLGNSPLVGKGNTSIKPLIVVPVDPVYGASEITPPGADLGCYQLNGTGNRH